MNLYLFDKNEIVTFNLPDKKIGNFWMTDNEGKNVVNISAVDNEWVISGSNNAKLIYNNNYVENNVLSLKTFYIVEKNDNKYLLFIDASLDTTFKSYVTTLNSEIKIGSNQQCDICFNNGCLNDIHAVLTNSNNIWYLNASGLVYVNNVVVSVPQLYLSNGDVINIYGLKIVVAYGMLFINNPINNLMINHNILSLKEIVLDGEIVEEEIEDLPLYKDEEFFFKSPRLRRIIETLNMKIDSPPKKEEEKNMPLIYTLGPMMTMGASSIINLSTTLSKIADNEITVQKAAPTLVVSGAMICSMFVWPFLTKNYEKGQKRKKEKKRQLRYKTYLSEKRNELQNEYNTQIKILEENLLSTEACYDIIVNKKRTLWERKIEQGDFLTVRVGNGQLPFDAQINYHKEEFTMDDDDLIKMLETMVEDFSLMNNVPISYSFAENNITAINGVYPKKIFFIYNMLLQMMCYHSYDNLKIVIFTNESNKNNWNFLKDSLYCFTDDKNMRFFASNTEEMQEVSLYLDKVLEYRKNIIQSNNINASYQIFNSYYMIIVDDIDLSRKINIVDNVLKEKNNLGFSLIILEDKLSKLPSQCTNFISVGDKSSGILKNDIVSNTQIRFMDEVNASFDMSLVSKLLSNVPIYVESKAKELPNSVTFLEMFGVGEVEQLNSLNRWKENDPTKSLKTRVGLNENCDPFILDLHEKQHGPHGLVAGMTGSGKSEFIITYILSMAVNYSPEEVAFVLIDYKGGGLTGAFENKEMGIKLPHVVGTITNLDKTEINRALSSINSELRRRQAKFNEVREKTGESTIDIYKYQKMYRNGVVDEPMPHLLIISDEFAELKSQQPEFMDDLISTARIGRSLGIHLILATQKPSGVVDGQIWSNSKFKVCLKVQDKSDSMEMIKCADAAELKNVGRFYLQVGYNEYFALGQSAWSGASYYPCKEFKKQVDKNIYFIDNIGSVYKTLDNSGNKRSMQSNGEELANVLKYVIDVSNTMNFNLRPLWQDKIPAVIYISNLLKKYQFNKENFVINPVVGEYDDPANQSQDLLTLPITLGGNVLLYGMSDSGRDEFLQSLVYSIITTYTTDEVNLYLLDYGAETLMNFNEAPQVGGVILNTDDEKLDNFVKMITTIVNQRKKLFMSFNGNYMDYIKMSGNTLPNVVVMINVIEIFTENYMDLFDKLFPAIRDGNKYGVSFVITTTNQNSVRFKVTQSCKQLLSLQLNNESEYRDVLGKTGGIVPSKYLGRGLVKLDKVCEFQTVSIVDDEDKLKHINETIALLNSKGMKKANEIPMMPDVIRIDKFMEKYKGLDTVPIGIYKDDLTKGLYDFTKKVINIISTNELENSKRFMCNFLKVLEINKKFNKIVVDASNYFEEFNYNINMVDKNLDEFIEKLNVINDEIQEKISAGNNAKDISNTLCVIIGIEKFMGKLSDDKKKVFKDILNQNKELLKINFIFIDIPSGFKKFEYEDWYKNNVDNDDGIWIGFGLTQQYVIKLLIQPSKMSNIDNDYAVVIKNGVPKLLKLINEFKE